MLGSWLKKMVFPEPPKIDFLKSERRKMARRNTQGSHKGPKGEVFRPLSPVGVSASTKGRGRLDTPQEKESPRRYLQKKNRENEANRDQDGKLSREEFFRIMKKQGLWYAGCASPKDHVPTGRF